MVVHWCSPDGGKASKSCLFFGLLGLIRSLQATIPPFNCMIHSVISLCCCFWNHGQFYLSSEYPLALVVCEVQVRAFCSFIWTFSWFLLDKLIVGSQVVPTLASCPQCKGIGHTAGFCLTLIPKETRGYRVDFFRHEKLYRDSPNDVTRVWLAACPAHAGTGPLMAAGRLLKHFFFYTGFKIVSFLRFIFCCAMHLFFLFPNKKLKVKCVSVEMLK